MEKATAPPPTSQTSTAETATFGAGCFWGVESAFREVSGVLDVAVGYAGGTTSQPTYEDVCTGRTGHAEVVEVSYDPSRVSYEQLLAKFFEVHDPAQVNRQGWDVGTQYRSAVFFHSPKQQAAAERAKQELEARSRKPIATEITAAPPFWRAEEYHQRYFEKTGRAGCKI